MAGAVPYEQRATTEVACATIKLWLEPKWLRSLKCHSNILPLPPLNLQSNCLDQFSQSVSQSVSLPANARKPPNAQRAGGTYVVVGVIVIVVVVVVLVGCSWWD